MAEKENSRSCPLCQKILHSQQYLEDHIRTHTGERPFKCQHCSYSATSYKILKKHVRSNRQNLQCKKCDHKFCTSVALRRHEGASHPTQSNPLKPAFTAPSADETIGWKIQRAPPRVSILPNILSADMVTHAIHSTSEDPLCTLAPIPCLHCSFCCYDSSKLEKHLLFRRPGSPLKCQGCNFKSCTSSGIMNHRKEVHLSLSINSSYNKTPPKKSGLAGIPETFYNREGKRNYRCVHCRKVFKTKFKLERHIRVHTGERPYKCNYCSYASSDSSSMRNHKRTRTGLIRRCSRCCLRFCNDSLLRRHEKTCGSGSSKGLPRELSHNESASRANRVTESDLGHKKGCTLHGSPRKLRITLSFKDLIGKVSRESRAARKKFDNAGQENISKKGKKFRVVPGFSSKEPIRCAYCPYESKISTHMIRHTRRHTGEKPYQCSVCPHRSTRKDSMKLHELTHSRK